MKISFFLQRIEHHQRRIQPNQEVEYRVDWLLWFHQQHALCSNMRVPNVKQIQDHCLRLLLGLSLVAFVAQFDAAQIQAASGKDSRILNHHCWFVTEDYYSLSHISHLSTWILLHSISWRKVLLSPRMDSVRIEKMSQICQWIAGLWTSPSCLSFQESRFPGHNSQPGWAKFRLFLHTFNSCFKHSYLVGRQTNWFRINPMVRQDGEFIHQLGALWTIA